MAYCTASDIAKDFANMVFSASSKVTDTDLAEFITDADALIDSYLAGRYVTPITGTAALATCKLFSRTLVSDKVTGILQIKQATNSNANQNVRSGLSTKDVLGLLEDMRDGKSQLSDAVLVKAAGGINSFNVKEGIVPQFSKDTDAW